MKEKKEHTRTDPVEGLPGQQVLPDLVSLFGSDTVLLKTEHELFVRELVACGNATDAYVRAYGDVDRPVARRNASRLLTNADIRRRYEQMKREIIARAEYSAEDAYRDLVNVIRYDRRRLFGPNWQLRAASELDPDGAALIDGVEEAHTKQGHRVKVLLPKRLDAIEKILRYHGAYRDVTEHRGQLEISHRHQLSDEILEQIAVGA